MRDARFDRRKAACLRKRSAHPYTLLIFRPPEITRRRGGMVQESTCVLYGAGALQSMYARLGVDENNNCVIDRSYVNARRLPESCTAVCKYRKCTILFKALSALPLDFRVTLHEREVRTHLPLSFFVSWHKQHSTEFGLSLSRERDQIQRGLWWTIFRWTISICIQTTPYVHMHVAVRKISVKIDKRKVNCLLNTFLTAMSSIFERHVKFAQVPSLICQ